jgi:signal transduction protein with GAF and PtsI domain
MKVGPAMKFPERQHWTDDDPAFGFLHEIARDVSLAPLHEVLKKVLAFVTTLVKSDSCFVYVREGDELVLRSSKNPHPEMVDRLKLKVGEGITGWVAQHREPVALALNAWKDPRFKLFNDLPEDRFESFLSVPLFTRGRVVGVINLQNRKPYHYSPREIGLISTIGALVGAEIEMARLESENADLSDQLETRTIVERAKGILQRSLGINELGADMILQEESRKRGKPLKQVAESVLFGDELKRQAAL